MHTPASTGKPLFWQASISLASKLSIRANFEVCIFRRFRQHQARTGEGSGLVLRFESVAYLRAGGKSVQLP